jgi:hypothetical protein
MLTDRHHVGCEGRALRKAMQKVDKDGELKCIGNAVHVVAERRSNSSAETDSNLSAIIFERYTSNGFIEFVKIGVAGDRAFRMNLTHIPVTEKFSMQLHEDDRDDREAGQ